MASERICFRVRLYFSGGLLSRAAGGIRFGLDQAMLRAHGNHSPALPGSLIKGNLRHAWQALDRAGHQEIGKYLLQLLGPPPIIEDETPKSAEAGDTSRAASDQRGALLFDDLWLAEGGTKETIRHRIRIDEETGAVKRGALLMSERIEPASEQSLCFTGRIELGAPVEIETKKLEKWIANGLAYTQALGAHKGIGWGALEKVEVETETETMPALPTTSTSSSAGPHERLGLALEFDRPFCIPHPKGNENTIYSREVIPGNVIKGALATSFDRCWGQGWRKYQQQFDALRVSHAFPSNRDTPIRPLALPHGLALGEDGILYGIGATEPPEDALPLRFLTDWKARELGELRDKLNWPDLGRDLRVHNRIDPTTGATPEDALYTVESIRPDNRRWLLNFNMPDGQDLAWLADLLEALDEAGAHPLYPIGRTKARAALVRESNGYHTHGAVHTPPPLRDDDEITILLQTPARLLDLEEVHDIPSTAGQDALCKHYANSWRTMTKQPPAKAGGFVLRTESPDTRRLNDAF